MVSLKKDIVHNSHNMTFIPQICLVIQKALKGYEAVQCKYKSELVWKL